MGKKVKEKTRVVLSSRVNLMKSIYIYLSLLQNITYHIYPDEQDSFIFSLLFYNHTLIISISINEIAFLFYFHNNLLNLFIYPILNEQDIFFSSTI